MSSLWDKWPVWDSKDSFHTENFHFVGSVSDYTGVTGKTKVAILKDREFIEIYRELMMKLNPRKILEIGFFQGGSSLFLADMVRPQKIVAVDKIGATRLLLEVTKKAGFADMIDFMTISNQDATDEIRTILDEKFGNEPLDLIIDDCSHLHDLTKICFEHTFGYLRPGGKYIIEDWGWTHWQGEPWQTPESFFNNTPSMTNLIFELLMILPSSNGALISHIEIANQACVIITRGPALPYKSKIVLKDSYNLAGRNAAFISVAAEFPPVDQSAGAVYSKPGRRKQRSPLKQFIRYLGRAVRGKFSSNS